MHNVRSQRAYVSDLSSRLGKATEIRIEMEGLIRKVWTRSELGSISGAAAILH